ncbi:unnamed protein product [Sympodiomycopsis kandeliae]
MMKAQRPKRPKSSRAHHHPSKKNTKGTARVKTEPKPVKRDANNGNDEAQKTGEPSAKQSSAWSKEEAEIFWQDVVRQYKPDWNFINKGFEDLQQSTGKVRTLKARQLYCQRHVRGELLSKAGLSA